MAVIDVTDKVVDFFIGEGPVAFTIDTHGDDTGQGIDASPSAVGTAVLYDEDNTDVTATEASGSASLSGDVITTPNLTLLGEGLYKLIIPVTVSGNGLYVRLRINVRDATPT